MTLGELKELIDDLERLGSHCGDIMEMDVYAEYDYGDHGHTRALTPFSDLQIIEPFKTAYSDSGLAIKQNDDYDDYDDNESKEVVVLTRR